MADLPTFSAGARVRIVDDYFDEKLRGAIGTVVDTSKASLEHNCVKAFWVEFDDLHPNEVGGADAGGFLASDLRLA